MMICWNDGGAGCRYSRHRCDICFGICPQNVPVNAPESRQIGKKPMVMA